MSLSKSQYIKGLQCHKALWLVKNKPELASQASAERQAIFTQGIEVGILAQQLFPNGKYEVTFDYNGNLAIIDILIESPDGLEIYEVKSSTGAKEVYLDDLAFQVYTIQNLGYKVTKACIVHINNEYIYDGIELNLSQLFTIEDLTSLMHTKAKHVPHLIKEMNQALTDDEPLIDIGPHCSKPYDCDFKDYCWVHIPEVSVFSLSNARGKDWEFYKQGYIKLEDIPLNKSSRAQINAAHLQQIESYIQNQSSINKEAISKELSKLKFPLAFLDFETYQDAIPQYAGARPYEQTPFQYSLHILASPDAKLEHKEFLADPTQDPRKTFITQLIADLPKSGSIVVYNRSFEAGILNKMADYFPELKVAIEETCERLFDLMLIFQRRDYYHPEMQGSYSIKKVLPALVPELRHSDLAISDGAFASRAFVSLRELENQNEIETIRSNLLEYCKLDTFAMVEIWRHLVKITNTQ